MTTLTLMQEVRRLHRLVHGSAGQGSFELHQGIDHITLCDSDEVVVVYNTDDDSEVIGTAPVADGVDAALQQMVGVLQHEAKERAIELLQGLKP